MFMRTSSTRLYAELRLSQNAIPMNIGGNEYSQVAPYTRTAGKSVYPTEVGLQMGIGW
jgi:hypothetical protein